MFSFSSLSSVCLYVTGIVLLNSQGYFAQESTTDVYEEIDFSCMIGNIAKECIEDETGRFRFLLRNSSKGACQTVTEFFGTSDKQSTYTVEKRLRKRSENKIFACGSYFEWKLHTDTDPNLNVFEEIHDCLYDTRENLQRVLKSSRDGCTKYSGTYQKTKLHQKQCVCFTGRLCNTNFKRDFKGEPKEANSLCKNTTIETEAPNDDSLSKGSDTIRVSGVLAFIIIVAYSMLKICHE